MAVVGYPEDCAAEILEYNSKRGCYEVRGFRFRAFETSGPTLTTLSPVKDKKQLLGRLRAHIAEFRELGGERLGVFGSFEADVATPDSDIDILVEFAPGDKTYRAFSGLADLLEQILGRDVDLVTPESLRPRLKSRIYEDIDYVA